MVEFSFFVEKVVVICQNVELDKEVRKFEINMSDILERDLLFVVSVYFEFDEVFYFVWVEKLKEVLWLSKDEKVMELGDRNNVIEERYVRVEVVRKKVEEKKLVIWEVYGYEFLFVEELIFFDDVDFNLDVGFV